MKKYTISDLFLAYRQAKIAQYYEKRGVGLIRLAKFEKDLATNLIALQRKLAKQNWFDGVNLDDIWVTPKSLPDPTHELGIREIGSSSAGPEPLDVQLRVTPSPEYLIVEVLFLWEFGPALEKLISSDSLGYRLDTRGTAVDKSRRWLFEYWPTKYQQYREDGVAAARRHLEDGENTAVIVTADLARFYDSIDPRFLLEGQFLEEAFAVLSITGRAHEFKSAARSLISAIGRYQTRAAKILQLPIETGIPIGGLTSRLIANLALTSLDARIRRCPQVLSFRRYVDDFIVVADDGIGSSEDEILEKLLPISRGEDDSWVIDSKAVERIGSRLVLQDKKTRILKLSGEQGLDFLSAVGRDFAKLVSGRRAFLDVDALSTEAAANLIRASRDGQSSLRVFRDADRAKLERFALSTSIATFERASSMIDPDEGRSLIRRHLEQLVRILDHGGNWVTDFDVALRLLQLAVKVGDMSAAEDALTRMDAKWRDTTALRGTVAKMLYMGHEIPPTARASESLCSYLHERRLEAVCACIRTRIDLYPEGIAPKLKVTYKRRRLGWVALKRRAECLAMADLRSLDREADLLNLSSSAVAERAKAVPDLQGLLRRDSSLAARLDRIETFVRRCSEFGDKSWVGDAARLFASPRPPSYFDVARRLLYRAESEELPEEIFAELLAVVNAVRGTNYQDAIGESNKDGREVRLLGGWQQQLGLLEQNSDSSVRLILGNLVAAEAYWDGAATAVAGGEHGQPVLSLQRLLDVEKVLRKAYGAASRVQWPSRALLVLPELSLPRAWLRPIATHVVSNGKFALVTGLEYRHETAKSHVINQAFGVFPGLYGSVAAWPWTKRRPAREEAAHLAKKTSPLKFPSPKSWPDRVVVDSPWGRLSVLICSELIETRLVSELLGRANLVLCPAWNRDTASYDHLIQTVGFQLHAIIAVANNGHYSDCRAWAPRFKRWERDLCRQIERDVSDVVFVDLPLESLVKFHASADRATTVLQDSSITGWRPLPPDWP
ncbi:RNA-directed DNA polymerase [Abyssibacter profundi]|uniref:RNA-directed DNA polymerase n=1 Tax=Abyssibacter profundi TaxID=2182787 RepID=UPI001402D044|nr:RNA-directed DNA polymerase [Abyssibacter profundi]